MIDAVKWQAISQELEQQRAAVAALLGSRAANYAAELAAQTQSLEALKEESEKQKKEIEELKKAQEPKTVEITQD